MPRSDRSDSSLAELTRRQLKRETDTLEEACKNYEEMLASMAKLGKSSHLAGAKKCIIEWYPGFTEAIHQEQQRIEADEPGTDRMLYGPLLMELTPDKIAIITMQIIINATVTAGTRGVKFTVICLTIGEAIQAEVNLAELKSKHGPRALSNMSKPISTRAINLRARQSLESGEWTKELKVKLGAVLVSMFISTAKDTDGQLAFVHRRVVAKNKAVGMIEISDAVLKKLDGKDRVGDSTPRNMPMLVPPKPWTHFDRGAFLTLYSKVMRTKGSKTQTDALRTASLERVFEGLNALGRLQWRINTEVLDVAQRAWDDDLAVAGHPSQKDHLVPPQLDPSVKEQDLKAWRENEFKRKRTIQLNDDLHSLRCDMLLKLKIAQDFRNDGLYFPYNMDFRGRAYPMPPNLNHLGADSVRGLLKFSEKKPLGPRGLFWLKVQMANLFGFDKASFADRVRWTDDHAAQISRSAEDPLGSERWWTKAESPWQALGVCKELARIHETRDREGFLSDVPVHMDGSCNGLQHYAALGRDEEGGRQVNLIDGEKPRDVYSGVCRLVVEKVALDAARIPGPGATDEELKIHELAKAVNGLIDRKVVKQTVMTSVYGVTFIGARRQIQNRLEEKLAAVGGREMEEVEKLAYSAAFYVASLTMAALEETFTGARNTMSWLSTCARVVSLAGQPVNWVTPLGLPVSQPYRKDGFMTVKTVMQAS